MRQFSFQIKAKAAYNVSSGEIVAKDELQALKRLTALSKNIDSIDLKEIPKQSFEIDPMQGGKVYQNMTPICALRGLPKRKK